MIRLLLLILALACTMAARADFESYHLEFSIETYNGKIHKAYNHFVAGSFKADSLHLQDYFTDVMKKLSDDGKGNFSFYQKRYTYLYADYPEAESKFYYVADSTALRLSSIKKITLIEKHPAYYDTYLDNINNDAAWTKSVPVGHYEVSGFFCSYRIIIHQKSKAVDEALKELRALEEKFAENDEDCDNVLLAALQKLKGLKVVIVTSCSC